MLRKAFASSETVLKSWTGKSRQNCYPSSCRDSECLATPTSTEPPSWSPPSRAMRSRWQLLSSQGGGPSTDLTPTCNNREPSQRYTRRQTGTKMEVSVLFCLSPPTPGAALASKIQKMEEDTKHRRHWRFKVIELGGTSLKHQLQTLNPGPHSSCGARDCLPCLAGSFGICGANNICYAISCAKCNQQDPTASQPTTPQQQHQQQQQQQQQQHVYYGESARNSRCRSSGHVSQLLARDNNHALFKHSMLFHGGTCTPADFPMELVSRHKDPLTRQIAEGVYIKNSTRPLMNSRAEYRQPRVTRVMMARTLGEVEGPTPRQPLGPQPQVARDPTHQGPRHVTRRRGGGRTPPPLKILNI